MGRAIAAKAERRRVRRVLGDDLSRDLARIQDALNAQGERIEAFQTDATLKERTHEQDQKGLWGVVREHEGRLDGFAMILHGSLWSRLRWLLRGQ